MNPVKIVLPGGAGLVGQNLVARLVARGYDNIVVLDKHRANLAILAELQPGIVTEYADLATEGSWQRHFEGAAVVVMLQAQIGGLDYADFVRNNVTATQVILQTFETHRVPYLVHISSSVVESVADDFYTRSKIEQERIVVDSGIACPILRPTLMFGWFDRKHLGWLSRFMKRMPVFPVPGDGRFMRQPLYVGDFCNIIISCIDRRIAGGIYNISGHEKLDYIDMIRQIKAVTRAKAVIVTIPYGLFLSLLWVWSRFDRNPPFTTQQLKALVAKDEFEVIDWPGIFGVRCTPFREAIDETFNDPAYGNVALEPLLIMGQRIAVLGAGPMGLAVAYQLARDGHRPVVFEADDRVGGMTAAFDFSGLTIERYYHFHCISDHAFLKVLDELGIASKMRWVETKMGYWYQGRLQAWGNPVALLTFRGLGLVAKIRYGLHAFLCTKRRDWKPLDRIEATGWIRRAVGEEAYEVLWRRLFDYKFYDYGTNLSAAWIWSRIRRIGKSRYDLFREKLGYLEGGSDTLLKALHADIERHGGEIRLKSPVQEVIIEQRAIRGVRVDGVVEPFDKVVSTIPLPYVPRLMPDLPADLLARFRATKNIAVVCVIVKLRKAFTDKFWVNTNDPDMDIPGIVEYTNLRPLDHHIVYVPFYMPGEHPKFAEADTVFIDKVRRYLKKINATLTDDDFIDIRASRYRHAQPICQPGYLDDLPPVALPVQGLWLADTSYYYPEDRGISESIDFGRNMARMAVA